MDTTDAELETRALKLLGRREHSRLELWHKLRRRASEEADLTRALDRLEAEGWLDDSRFAEVYARHRIEAGYGPVRIRAELEQRGVVEEPEALAAVGETQWRHEAVRQREKRFGNTEQSEPLSWKEMSRQGRFLAQRGFSQSQIRAALAVVACDEDAVP